MFIPMLNRSCPHFSICIGFAIIWIQSICFCISSSSGQFRLVFCSKGAMFIINIGDNAYVERISFKIYTSLGGIMRILCRTSNQYTKQSEQES